jgi:hypothetical protein
LRTRHHATVDFANRYRKDGTLRQGDRSTKLVVLAVGAGLLGMAVLTGALGFADLVRVSGPAVGDVVAFDANFGVPEDLPTRLSVVRTDGSPCQLDLNVMRQVHGSLMVDSATEEAPHAYRLHWAGTHSSLGSDDCGTTADIVASDRVMATLLVASGGVGIGADKQVLPVYLLRHPPKDGR